MIDVAIGWEVYGQHRSALDLGWIGLRTAGNFPARGGR
jgi:hypothetical protein